VTPCAHTAGFAALLPGNGLDGLTFFLEIAPRFPFFPRVRTPLRARFSLWQGHNPFVIFFPGFFFSRSVTLSGRQQPLCAAIQLATFRRSLRFPRSPPKRPFIFFVVSLAVPNRHIGLFSKDGPHHEPAKPALPTLVTSILQFRPRSATSTAAELLTWYAVTGRRLLSLFLSMACTPFL